MKYFCVLFFVGSSIIAQTINNKYYHEAKTFALNNNLNQAIESIDKAIYLEGNKASPIFYFHKYEYLVRLQKYKFAFQVLNKSISHHPNSVLLLNARAEFYFALRKYKQAILDYEKIILFVVGDDLQNYNIKLASCSFLIRDFQKAAILTKQVLTNDPSNINALNLSAALYIELFNFKKAKKILQRILYQAPEHVATIINLGFVFQKKGQHKKALFYFNKALTLEPNNPVALCNSAYSKFKMRNYRNAMLDVQNSIRFSPSNSYAYMVRGIIYLKLEKQMKACVDFNIAENLNFSEQYGTKIQELLSDYCK
jgi:tetratricopeptide (TPR) repeat protein